MVNMDKNIKTHIENGYLRGASVKFLKTPKILEAARDHYGCRSINRFPYENGGFAGSKGAHPEMTALGNEMNTATTHKYVYFSKISIAILGDTNWYYKVTNDLAEDTPWGYKAGCGFLEGSCSSLESKFSEFGAG